MEPRDGWDDAVADDFALEVTDLRSGRVLDTVRPARLEDGVSPADEDDELTVAPLDAGADVRSWRRRRDAWSPRVRGVLVIGLALVICLATLSQLSGASGGLATLFQSPTSTAVGPVSAGESAFYFLEGAQWGKLTIDGRTAYLPQEASPVTLAVGRHVLQYQAAPFPTLRCRVTVPADAKHDTCPLITTIQFGDEMDGTRVVNLGCVPERLPADAADKLLLAVSAAFTTAATSATVGVGDHYLGADGAAAVARAPLHAAISFDVNLDPSRKISAGGVIDRSCVSFCASDGFGAGSWNLEAHALGRWSFVLQDGTYVSSSETAVDALINLTATWVNDFWSVGPVTGDSLGAFCYDALLGPPGGPAPITVVGNSSSSFAQAPDPMNGCVEVTSPSGDITPFTAGLPADASVFIYRFGVILAGNDLAHQQQPQFAVATAQERIAALEWFNPPA